MGAGRVVDRAERAAALEAAQAVALRWRCSRAMPDLGQLQAEVARLAKKVAVLHGFERAGPAYWRVVELAEVELERLVLDRWQG